MKFTNPNDPENIALQKTILNWVNAFQTEKNFLKITLHEQAHCGDEHCADRLSLVSLFTAEMDKVVLKIRKPLVFIRKGDIKQALQSTIF